MARKKSEPTVTPVNTTVQVPFTTVTPTITPITQNFGSEELHVLRDKINEIIKRLQ